MKDSIICSSFWVGNDKAWGQLPENPICGTQNLQKMKNNRKPISPPMAAGALPKPENRLLDSHPITTSKKELGYVLRRFMNHLHLTSYPNFFSTAALKTRLTHVSSDLPIWDVGWMKNQNLRFHDTINTNILGGRYFFASLICLYWIST